jgi:hypothetical protein
MSNPSDASIALFAYGSLRQPEVQRAKFGRLLEGQADALPGFALAPLTITDPDVVATSGAAVHMIARPTGDPANLVPGLVFAITPAELEAADDYEVDAYTRIPLRLASGVDAFVYVGAGTAGAASESACHRPGHAGQSSARSRAMGRRS